MLCVCVWKGREGRREMGKGKGGGREGGEGGNLETSVGLVHCRYSVDTLTQLGTRITHWERQFVCHTISCHCSP